MDLRFRGPCPPPPPLPWRIPGPATVISTAYTPCTPPPNPPLNDLPISYSLRHHASFGGVDLGGVMWAGDHSERSLKPELVKKRKTNTTGRCEHGGEKPDETASIFHDNYMIVASELIDPDGGGSPLNKRFLRLGSTSRGTYKGGRGGGAAACNTREVELAISLVIHKWKGSSRMLTGSWGFK